MIQSWLIRTLFKPANGFNAASPSEQVVFGARRPGFPFRHVSNEAVDTWLAFMVARDIKRVVCLLPVSQLSYYNDLLNRYRRTFGSERVCWAPVEDFHLANAQLLMEHILPFLVEADKAGEKTVVHCSGGVGRTGHVLAVWLVSLRGMSNAQAIQAVKRQGRNARESRDPGLDALLDRCRDTFTSMKS